MIRLRPLLLSPALVVVPIVPALAHGRDFLTEATALSTWRLTADIVIPIVLVTLVYVRGLLRRAAVTEPVAWWRHALFFAGLTAVFLALQSPIDPAAERLFSVHQILHLLLRTAGPMLIAIAWPQSILVAALPSAVRKWLLAPAAASRSIRDAIALVSPPVPATAIFIGYSTFERFRATTTRPFSTNPSTTRCTRQCCSRAWCSGGGSSTAGRRRRACVTAFN